MNTNIKYHFRSQIALIIVALIINTALLSDVRAEKDDIEPKSLISISKDDVVFGNKSAQIVVMEYFSPTCFHCKKLHTEVFPEIKKLFIETGKIAYVMREFVGNKQDFDASILARCSGNKEKYNQLMQEILAKQDQWSMSRDYRDSLMNIGEELGVSRGEYSKCLDSQSISLTILENTKLASKTSGFIGTPSIFINGKLLDIGFSKDSIVAAIKQEFLNDLETRQDEEELRVAIIELEKMQRELNEYQFRAD